MRVVIAEDEAPARSKMRRLLATESDVQVVGEAENGEVAVALLLELEPDVVLLDIQMPVLDGFGVIEAMGARRMPLTVFVTAYDEHAIRAFDVQAVDYLLKPVTAERLRQVVARLRERLGERHRADMAAQLERLVSATPNRPRYLQRVLVHDRGKAFLLPVERLDRIESERNILRLHSAGHEFQLRGTLTAFAARLDPGVFLRINRSEIVRLDAIREMHPWFHGDYQIVLHDGTQRMWSRRYRAQQQGEFGE
jgi:two-component system LytT family response regulator